MEKNDEISKENLIQLKIAFNQYNMIILDKIENFDWKDFQILDQQKNEIQQQIIQDFKDQFGQQYELCLQRWRKDLNTMADLHFSFVKYIGRCVKQLLKSYMDECLVTHLPNIGQIMVQLREYLDTSIISSKFKNEEKIKQNIFEEMQMLLLVLIESPIAYIDYFQDKFMQDLEEIDIMEEEIDLGKCRRMLNILMQKNMEKKYKKSRYLLGLVQASMMQFITLMNVKIAAIFNYHSSLVQEEIEIFKKKTEKLKIYNKYILIGFLKELSQILYEKIEKNLSEKTFFIQIDHTIVNRFAQFIIEKHEVFTMHQGEQAIINCQEYISGSSLLNDQEQMFKKYSYEEDKLLIEQKLRQFENKEMIVEKVFKDDGHTGLLLKIEGGKNYMIHKNSDGKIIILNAKYIQNNWQQYKKNEDDKGDETKAKTERLETILKNNPLTSYLRDPPPSGPSFVAQPLYLNTAASNLGSSLGYCLANINNYKSPGEFMRDFGFNATLNGTISVLVDQIPIIGTLFLLGGLGWSSLKLYKNRTANNNSKIIKVSQIAISTGTAIGGSIGGAILGEIFIPIPILGALVGGFIGSLFGGTSTQIILKTINKQKYIDMVEKLENNIAEGGYWDYSRQNLNNLGITNAFFMKSIPEDLYKKHQYPNVVWITMNILVLLALHHTKKDEKRLKLLKKSLKFENIDKSQNRPQQIDIQNIEQQNQEKNISVIKSIKNKQEIQENFIQIQEEFKKESEKEDSDPEEYINDDSEDDEHYAEEEDSDESDDENESWPSTIEEPQKWLLDNKIYTQDYLHFIEKFIDHILSDT